VRTILQSAAAAGLVALGVSSGLDSVVAALLTGGFVLAADQIANGGGGEALVVDTAGRLLDSRCAPLLVCVWCFENRVLCAAVCLSSIANKSAPGATFVVLTNIKTIPKTPSQLTATRTAWRCTKPATCSLPTSWVRREGGLGG
jgi:hypothetical protein